MYFSDNFLMITLSIYVAILIIDSYCINKWILLLRHRGITVFSDFIAYSIVVELLNFYLSFLDSFSASRNIFLHIYIQKT